MYYDVVLSVVVDVLVPLVGAALLVAIAYGVRYLRARVTALQSYVAREALLAAIGEAEHVARRAVEATRQTYVDSIKRSRQDGRLTPEEAREAFYRARDAFLAGISRESLRILEQAIGPVQTWLSSLLEAHVAEAKRSDPIRAGVIELASPKS